MNSPPATRWFVLIIVAALMLTLSLPAQSQTLKWTLRSQQPIRPGAPQFHRISRPEQWNAAQTAVIVCDMWDSHHCVNAVRRVAQVAPRIDQFCDSLRNQGVTIIHAPSGCMAAYENHRARNRASSVAVATNLPEQIANWCDQIPSEESAAYPIDQSDGGEDDDPDDHRQWAETLQEMGRNPRAPWIRQTEIIAIDESLDFISDSGTEIWSILTERQIQNVILVGVHTNMCVLGRPFGLRRLAAAGKNVVLARDLTDTMYNPQAWPYANHFTGTDLIVQHVERYVCPTISSNQLLGGDEFQFQEDQRKKLVMLIAEDEYQTNETLPAFAAKHLSTHFSVHYAWGSEQDRNQIIGVDQLNDADAMLVSVRRRALPVADLEIIRRFVAQGKPVIGIRTASHAFSLRGKQPPAGSAVWETFDGDVFGGSYSNHFGNELRTQLSLPNVGSQHAILAASDALAIEPGGSLYRVLPLAAGTQALIAGEVNGEPVQPVAWTFIRSDGGRSFYTSLGHADEFKQPQFEALLSAAIHWACAIELPSLEQVTLQNERYQSGAGKQRK